MQQTIFSCQNISKRFGTIQALSEVCLEVEKGEVLGLLGANGAGKSTLLKIIGGIQDADHGDVLLKGLCCSLASAHEAKQRGIISVHQELNIFCNMTVAENLFLGNEKRNALGLIDWKTTFREAEILLQSVGLSNLNPRDLVADLSIANRQILEIARAIYEDPLILLLDEPTSSLSEDQIEWLFKQVRQLTEKGTTVVYVSHRLDEVTDICDRAVVLRDGKLVAVLDKESMDRDTIVYHMVGHEVEKQERTYRAPGGDILLECQNLTQPGVFTDISFKVHAGEILGIGGLVGSGRSELLNALFGTSSGVRGNVQVRGKDVAIGHPKEALKEGIALVSEDRKEEGLFLPENARVNLVASTLSKHSRLGFIDRAKEKASARTISSQVQFDPKRMESPTGLLSGGNQQKIVIGKSLLTDYQVLLLDEPTRGVDVSARAEIYEIIRQAAQDNRAVILVSSDWEELTMFADRVIVMSEGRLVGELEADAINQANIMHLCTLYQTAKAEEKKAGFNQKLLSAFSKHANATILSLMLLALILTGPLVTPFFFKAANFNNMIWQTFIYFLLTLGQLAVVIAGGIDLSISASMSVSAIVGMKLILAFPQATWIGILGMLLFGLLIGWVNGAIVVYGKIDSFIGTLGTQLILSGLALILIKRPIGPAPAYLKAIANRSLFGLPLIFFLGILIFALFGLFYHRTRSGRYLYAVGESQEGTSWLGLKANRHKISAYMISSFMSVLAAYYMLGRSGAAEPTIDINLMLNSVAYALIGGGSLAGGKGSITGSVLVAFTITVLMNILNHVGMNLYTQNIIRGTVVVLILVIYEGRRMKGSNLKQSI